MMRQADLNLVLNRQANLSLMLNRQAGLSLMLNRHPSMVLKSLQARCRAPLDLLSARGALLEGGTATPQAAN